MVTTTASAGGPAPAAKNIPGWVADILGGLTAPPSQNNVQKLEAWNACEGNATGGSGLPINNPFNTTLGSYGGTAVNSAGVRHYPSWAAGKQATLDTLHGAAYKSIVTNLQQDGTQSDFASAVGSSPWGTNGACIARTMGQPYQGGNPSDSSSSTPGSGSGDLSACVVSTPKVPLVGSSCLLTKGNLKALKGGLILAAGGVMLGLGVVILAAYGFDRSGAAQVARTVTRATPQGRAVTRSASRAGGGRRQTPRQGPSQTRTAARRAQARQRSAQARQEHTDLQGRLSRGEVAFGTDDDYDELASSGQAAQSRAENRASTTDLRHRTRRRPRAPQSDLRRRTA